MVLRASQPSFWRYSVLTVPKQCGPKILHGSGSLHWNAAANKLTMVQTAKNPPVPKINRLWLATGVICRSSNSIEILNTAKLMIYSNSAEYPACDGIRIVKDDDLAGLNDLPHLCLR